MKAFLRKIVRGLAGWPLIGRLVRIGVAVIRLPEFRDQTQNHVATLRAGAAYLQNAQARHNAEPVYGLDPSQLPTLLEAISRINARQLAVENSNENLRKSVPIALRKLVREVTELRGQIAELQQQQTATALLQDHAAGVTQHLKSLQKAVENLQAESAQLFSTAAHTNNKTKDIEESVSYAVQRIEFVRRELMFELRYGAGRKQDSEQLKVESEIISKDKYEVARRENLRLNLGCGHIALDGYINVDRRALPGVDVVAEVDSLPVAAGEANEIFSAHLLEHFPEEQLRRELLPYYHSLLKTGGIFHAVVPDAEAMIAHYAQGDYPYEDMREVIYGAQDYDGDFHFNMFTPDSLKNLLLEAGFVDPKIIESGRKNGRCYEFEIVAEKK